ncbi:MAG TPA: trigger factor family protein, partial [Elusimicrobiota bacterium]|nr:trigger factor family protein [Elusimicrobiota bacterium]
MFGWKKKGKEGAGTESESEAPRADVKVKVKDRKNCAVLLAVEVPADQVRKATEDSFRRVQSRAKLPGFRPGKAPMEMVKKN